MIPLAGRFSPCASDQMICSFDLVASKFNI